MTFFWMIGISVDPLASWMIWVYTLPPRFSSPNTGTCPCPSRASASIPFSSTAKVTFINFNFSTKGFTCCQLCLLRNQQAKPLEIVGSCLEIYTHKWCGTSSCCSSYKMLDQFLLLSSAYSTLSHLYLHNTLKHYLVQPHVFFRYIIQCVNIQW